ncbi:MAG: precorrin-3B C(17)-methyltransferase [Azorhizobium sp. 32-67-21]|nr:MAG: precorrin-3B C(17)-methyltransferase [Azorhizobium sp. 32-67-21]
MSGRLAIIGLGPGSPGEMTPDAGEALAAADELYGYGPYLDRIALRPGQSRHASDNREERARGVTAMLAVAARVGAPLGHDFCAINLSNNLKPWELVERRLRGAAEAGFVMALYNPVSRARPWQLGRALDLLRTLLPATTPVVFGRAAGRPDEDMRIVTLAEAEGGMADMATCVIIGSPATRIVERNGLPPLVYSPRSAG